ncbi:MAG: lysoplasmalogenase [Candidatus Marinimicrobia bacterium]|nr:lysoplasmalogenase [Candidatus Neomarinimicrobiota bacterium]
MNFKLIFITLFSISVLLGTIYSKHMKINKNFFVLKPLTLISIIIMGVLSQNIDRNILNQLILIGILFSLLGDILLMFGKKEFLIGMGAFFLTHIFYINAFILDGFHLNYIFIFFTSLFSILFYLFIYSSLNSHKIPVLIYSLAISTMLITSRSYFQLHDNINGKLILLGAILFTISDILLAIKQYKGEFPYCSTLVYLTYFSGQYFICLTMWY